MPCISRISFYEKRSSYLNLLTPALGDVAITGIRVLLDECNGLCVCVCVCVCVCGCSVYQEPLLTAAYTADRYQVSSVTGLQFVVCWT